MRYFFTAVIAALCIVLSLAGCADERTENGVDNTGMSDTAEALGITEENYPRIDGSTSTFGIVSAVWRAMHEDASGAPEAASKTVPSYKKLIAGEVDLIIVPYASDDVLALAEEAGVELVFEKIASEALVFITPEENTAENITREQVRSIYLDYGIRSWEALGGPARELVPICRNADSGSQSQMDNLVLENAPMHEAIKSNYVELTMEGMLEQVAFYHSGGLSGSPTESYALGYTLYTYLEGMDRITGIGDSLKLLAFDGVYPTRETITDGTYPLADGYYAVTRGDLPESHSAHAVVDWLLSADGRAAIENEGLIPGGGDEAE